jgi:hypothetical protein
VRASAKYRGGRLTVASIARRICIILHNKH